MFDFLKKNSKVIDVKVEGDKGVIEKKNRWLIMAVAVAVCVLVFWNTGGEKKKEHLPDEKNSGTEICENYVKDAEKRLEEILSEIKGAGTVRVMMNFDVKGEKVLARNKTDSLETQITENGSESRTSGEESILLYDSGGDQMPYVIKENLPSPSGVLVVASGASEEKVRLEIYEAVRALYGISAHRIKVTGAAEQKN